MDGYVGRGMSGWGRERFGIFFHWVLAAVLVAGLFSLACPAASAATYYVATDGSDNDDGSQANPWATLQHAVDTIAAGDTILVEPGTYDGCRIETSGAVGSPKTLKAETAGTVVLDAPSSAAEHNGILEIEKYGSTISYWVIDGFEVDGQSGTYRCIDLRDTDHITVKNNEVHDAFLTGVFTGFSDYVLMENNESYDNFEHGIYNSNSADYGVVRGNYLHDNAEFAIHTNGDSTMGGDGIMSDWLIEKNTSVNDLVGVNCDQVEEAVIRNNLIYDFRSKGFSLYGYTGISSRDNRILNNTALSKTDGSGYFVVFIHRVNSSLPGPTGNKLFNNILYHYSTASNRGSICIHTSGETDFESDYNVVMEYFALDDGAQILNFAQWKARGYDQHSIQASDTALFTDPANSDYELKSGSPAIDAGTALNDVTDDIEGTSRPLGDGHDIGAYEYPSGPPPDVDITTTSLPDGFVNIVYSQTLSATGGVTPYAWSIESGSLPAGLSLGSSTGVISGTPTNADTANFTVEATDSQNPADSDQQALSITVQSAPSDLEITTTSLPDGDVDVAYSQTLAATGGVQPYTWSIISGDLPAGLSLSSSTGQISGTPSTYGTSNFTVQVTDDQSPADSDTQALSITIDPANLVITTTSLGNGTVNVAYSRTVQATGGEPPYTWSLASGSLPAGLSLNSSTGQISGTPTSTGTSNFTVEVEDSQSTPDTDQQALSITVNSSGTPLAHPRIWLSPAILDRLVAAKNANTPEWSALKSWCDSNLGASPGNDLYCFGWYVPIMNYGLVYQVTGNQTYGNEGVRYLKALLRDRDTMGDGLGGADHIEANQGYVARTLGVGTAVGRDWLDGATDLTSSLINETAARLDDWITWYNTEGYNRGDPENNFFEGYFTMVYTAAIGLEGDPNYESAWMTKAEELWYLALPLINGRMDKGDWNEGWNYGFWAVRELLGYPHALDTGTTRPNHWNETDWATDVIRSNVHFLYPNRNYFMDDGRAGGDHKGDPRSATARMLATTSAVDATTAGLGVWFGNHIEWEPNDPELWEDLLYTDSSIQEVAPTPANMGGLSLEMPEHAVVRSGDWNDRDATYVDAVARVREVVGTEAHTGEIKMASRREHLLTDGHMWQRGSQFSNVPNIAGTYTEAPYQDPWPTTTVFDLDTVDGVYAHFKMDDLDGVYDGHYNDQPSLEYFRRDAVFMEPDYLVVFDNIETKTTSNVIAEQWHLYGNPTLSGDTATISKTLAKMFVRTLTPAVTLSKFEQSDQRPGVWRVNASLNTAAIDNKIVTVIQAADPSAGSMTPVDLMQPTSFIGAHVKDTGDPKIVLFATAQDPSATSCSFNFTPVASPTNVVIVGLQPATGFDVDVTDGGGGSKDVAVTTGSEYTSTDSGALMFDVLTNGAPLTITTLSLPDGQVGTSYSETLQATGGDTPYTWSVNNGSLPAGLSLASSTGVISGTPTTAETAGFTIKVTDDDTPANSDLQALSITVYADLDVTTTSLPDGQVGVSYNQTLAAGGGLTPYTWSITSGNLPAGLSLASATGVISGTPTAYGTSNFTVKVEDDQSPPDSDQQALSITVDPVDLEITTTSLPDGTVSAAYSQTLSATGGDTPYTWSVYSGSLPSGLSLNSSTGEINGTPTSSGTSNFTVEVEDDWSPTNSDTQALSIVINEGYENLVITTTSLPDGQAAVSYSQTLAATGGKTPYTWSVVSGSLPAGLSLGSATGTISGTPTAHGTSNFTVEVEDDQGTPDTDQQALSITVIPETLEITTTSLPDGTVNSSYSQTVSATGGDTPYMWSVASGSLPAGLSLNSSTGQISGTPTSSGNSNFTIEVEDDWSTPNSDQQALSITINEATGGVSYEVASSEGEQGTSSSTWQTKVTLQFTPSATDDYLILGFTEHKSTGGTGYVGVRMQVDSTTESELYRRRRWSGTWWPFTAMKVVNLDNSSHTITIQYRSSDSGHTTSLRKARIVAIKQGDLDLFSAADDDTESLTTTMTDYVTRNWTPSTSDDYLLIYFAEVSADYAKILEIEAVHEDSVVDSGVVSTRRDANYLTWASFSVASCDTAQQTMKIRAKKITGSCQIRRARVVALRLTGSPLAGYQSASSLEESGTNSESWQEKIKMQWNAGDAADWLVLASARLIESGGALAKGRLQLDDTTTIVEQERNPISGSQWMGFNAVDVRELHNTTDLDVDYASSNDSYTCTIKNVRLVALPLEAGTTGPDLLDITTTSLPDGQVGVSYSQTVQATGGVTPYSWSVVSGSLPAGLSLGSSTGTISGTPTAYGATNFTLEVTDDQSPADSDQQSLWITIDPETLEVTTTSLPDGQVGVSYSQTVSATGGDTPYTWSVVSGSLPAGLSLGSSTGTISGTPTAYGTSNFTVEVEDDWSPPNSDQQALSITVDPETLEITTTSLPDGTQGVSYSQTVQATGGDTPYTWSVVSGSLPAGLSLGSSTGTISGTPTAYGTSNFTVEVEDDWSPPNSDQQALSITVDPADLDITTTSLDEGRVGVSFSDTVEAAGGATPYSWSVVSGSLPGGLSLNSSTGVISGTPTSSGTSNFTMEVEDDWTPQDSDQQALSITVYADLEVTTTSLPGGQVGVSYSQTVQATGGKTPYTWSVVSGSLPAGLSLGSSTGTISGTPTAHGTSNFTVEVSDDQSPADSDQQALSITVDPETLEITTTSLPDGQVGVSYSQAVQATGGKTPYTWSVVS
ncbi:MAG: putative Ig domain-containing protein, partial [Planctomycetota bacterium]